MAAYSSYLLRWIVIVLIVLGAGQIGTTNAQHECPLAPHLTIGQQGQVLGTTSNNLRESPALTGALVGTIPGGGVFEVLAGPECEADSGFNWWQVNYAGQIGWTAEGEADTYFLEPFDPALSAHANGQIIFVADRDAPLQYDIYSMNANGSNLHSLTQTAGANTDPIWSPDGTQIAFESDRDGFSARIYLMNADGSDQRALTSSRGSGAAWSPDGTQIAFHANRENGTEIYTINLDGSDLLRLTNSPGNDINPVWSPDGHQIAFVSFRDGDQEIYVINADGSEPRNLTNNPGKDTYPAWAPDGQQIAFTSDRDGDQEIYIIQVDGSNPQNLTQRAQANDYRPIWSPDGRQIVFDSWDDTGNRDIYLMNADGSHLMNLTQDPGEDLGPSWSPDGSQIAFLSTRDGPSGIYVINTDGTNLRRLTYHDADREPFWSPAADSTELPD